MSEHTGNALVALACRKFMEVSINARSADVITSNILSLDNPEGLQSPADLDGIIEDLEFVSTVGRVGFLPSNVPAALHSKS